MDTPQRITRFSLEHPKLVVTVSVGLTVLVALLAALGSLAPDTFDMLNPIKVDTDPENMLSEDEAVRVFHRDMKEQFGLHDMVVVGVVHEGAEGVYTPEILGRIEELTQFAATLQGEKVNADSQDEGVIPGDLISPSTVDYVRRDVNDQGRPTVQMTRLMPSVPKTQDQARTIHQRAISVPFLEDTLTTPDGKAIALYLPLTAKDLSYRVYKQLQEKIAEFDGPEKYYITGLPVAEDTFGVEMFIQMAISAPVAMVVIFLLMLLFFRKLVLIIAPMIIAMLSVILTMGLLIILGFPIHIMSSMIPIFIMPIAVLDSIHIISEFFERYQQNRDRKATMMSVMDDLFAPMLYTSLTSSAGFASLALTPIPPVQIFGLFVALGVMLAWALTVTFIPAYVMFISPATLENFGARKNQDDHEQPVTLVGRFLTGMGAWTVRRAKPILAGAVVVFAVALWGMSRINVNDNPIKWFVKDHPIREADRVLNDHFAGTYMAYLALESTRPDYQPQSYAQTLTERTRQRMQSVEQLLEKYQQQARQTRARPTFDWQEEGTRGTWFDNLRRRLQPEIMSATDEQLSAFALVGDFLDLEASGVGEASEPMDKQAYLDGLQQRITRLEEALANRMQQTRAHIQEIAAQEPPTARDFLSALTRRLEGGKEESQQPGGRDLPPLPGEDLDAPLDAPPAPPREDLDAAPAPLDSEGPGEPLPPAGGGPAPSDPSPEAMDPVHRIARRHVQDVFLADQYNRFKTFTRPDVLNWMVKLEQATREGGKVGKTNSLTTITRTIHRDLTGGTAEDYRIPNTQKGVEQTLDRFQDGSPNTRDDLWHFVTRDYRTTSAWIQLTSGDNQDMSEVVEQVAAFVDSNPPPEGVKASPGWFGLTYINVEWQEKMVFGMMEAFAGSFLVVLLLMTLLFRSPLWGLLSMIPLTVTIAAIYGAIGIIGKDYDMPVAVLSSLTLGLAVDFAIHFLARARAMHAREGSWQKVAPAVFGEPARAIVRNIIVIAVGFTPLLLAPLVPYQTVGILLATILLLSGIGTLLLLPALITVARKYLFKPEKQRRLSCNCGVCLVGSLALVGLIALTLSKTLDLTTLTWIGLILVPLLAMTCNLLSRRRKCEIQTTTGSPTKE